MSPRKKQFAFLGRNFLQPTGLELKSESPFRFCSIRTEAIDAAIGHIFTVARPQVP